MASQSTSRWMRVSKPTHIVIRTSPVPLLAVRYRNNLFRSSDGDMFTTSAPETPTTPTTAAPAITSPQQDCRSADDTPLSMEGPSPPPSAPAPMAPNSSISNTAESQQQVRVPSTCSLLSDHSSTTSLSSYAPLQSISTSPMMSPVQQQQTSMTPAASVIAAAAAAAQRVEEQEAAPLYSLDATVMPGKFVPTTPTPDGMKEAELERQMKAQQELLRVQAMQQQMMVQQRLQQQYNQMMTKNQFATDFTDLERRKSMQVFPAAAVLAQQQQQQQQQRKSIVVPRPAPTHFAQTHAAIMAEQQAQLMQFQRAQQQQLLMQQQQWLYQMQQQQQQQQIKPMGGVAPMFVARPPSK